MMKKVIAAGIVALLLAIVLLVLGVFFIVTGIIGFSDDDTPSTVEVEVEEE